MANPAPGFKRHPDHRITVEPYGRTVTVRFGNTVIASSDKALELREASYPPVVYVPFKDIYFEHLKESDTRTYCPFKGDASYWSVSAQGEAENDVMWAYQTPYDEMASIRNHGALYPDRVTIETSPGEE